MAQKSSNQMAVCCTATSPNWIVSNLTKTLPVSVLCKTWLLRRRTSAKRLRLSARRMALLSWDESLLGSGVALLGPTLDISSSEVSLGYSFAIHGAGVWVNEAQELLPRDLHGLQGSGPRFKSEPAGSEAAPACFCSMLKCMNTPRLGCWSEGRSNGGWGMSDRANLTGRTRS